MGKMGKKYKIPAEDRKQIATLNKNYIIDKVIGVGKYGIICSGTMGTDPNKVDIAVKIINLNKTSDEYRYKFLPKELWHLEELNHKYIVKVYDMKLSNNNFFIFMERGFGGDILDMLEQFKNGVPEPRAKYLYRMIASALKYIHDRGSAHRDIKCENILLMNKERTIAKLTDFGSSTTCFIEDTDAKTKHLILRDTYTGTANYSAPEIQRHKPYDAMKADVWSLGVVLYVMLQNEFPYDSGQNNRMTNESKRLILEFKWKYLSDKCKDLITKQLDIDPQRRITMAEVMKHSWLT